VDAGCALRRAAAGLFALVCGCNAITEDFTVGLPAATSGAGLVTGGSGGGGHDGGSDTGACGTVAMLHDDFDDGLPSPAFADLVSGGATIGEEGGSAIFRAPALVNADAARGSRHLYDLRGQEVSLEVREAPDPEAGQAYVYFGVRIDAANSINFVAGNWPQIGPGQIGVAANPPGATLGNVPYDAADQRWWRIREKGDVVYADTSPDGESWTTLGKADVPELFPVGAVEVFYGLGALATTSPVQARFDRMNGGGPFVPRWCPASTLVDGFDDAVQDAVWSRSVLLPGCSASEDGELVFALEPNMGETTCYYGTGAAYDLRGDSVSVHLAENAIVATAPEAATVSLRVQHDQSAAAELRQSGDVLRAVAVTSEGPLTLREVPYEAAVHAWWRLREKGGTLYWETSADGATFAPLYSAAVFFAPDAVDVSVGIARADTSTASGSLRLDDFNLPPR
jgi:hypothetical protein